MCRCRGVVLEQMYAGCALINLPKKLIKWPIRAVWATFEEVDIGVEENVEGMEDC